MFNEPANTSDDAPNFPFSSKQHSKTLDSAIQSAQDKLLSLQDPEGFWVFELEADCCIPAEYIMMMHYLDDIDEELQNKLPII
jgi:hypothetical protein